MTTGNNDFLAFGTAGGAYVLSQAAWAGYANRGSGYPSGVVPKEPFNKGLRQATVMAAMLGQFISTAGFDANDDGNEPVLLANFKNALQGNTGTALTISDFSPQQIADPGFIHFPGGLIVQWVHGTVQGPGAGNVVWPMPFPNSCIGAVISAETGALPQSPPTIASKDVNGAVIDCRNSGDSPYCFIIALGH